jgi:hypothetical protein
VPCPFAIVFRSLCLAAACVSLTAGLAAAERPKLVVLVSVDQMCQDYLVRFRDNFSDEGAFRRVFREGAHYTQCHHAHAFTVTAPGHSVQLTGAYPAVNGIIGNNWFDRFTGKDVYCVDDESVEIVGLPSGKPMSPRNLQVETVGDVLRLATGGRSKVFGVAIKDRAAILMTGQNPNAAFWLDDNLWVTSSYYRSDLPGYLRVLNEGGAIERFRGESWTLLLAPERYHNRGPDRNDWENPPKGFTSDFPHKIANKGELTALEYGDHVLFSPFGNEYTMKAWGRMNSLTFCASIFRRTTTWATRLGPTAWRWRISPIAPILRSARFCGFSMNRSDRGTGRSH